MNKTDLWHIWLLVSQSTDFIEKEEARGRGTALSDNSVLSSTPPEKNPDSVGGGI